jgi:PPM family protein phosphatase
MNKNVFDIGVESLIGFNRKINQDRLLVKVGEEDESGEFGLFAVADGMGGLSAGEKASSICIEELNSWWNEELSELLVLDVTIYETMRLISEKLENELYRINEKVISYGNEMGKKIGTTLTAAFVYMNHYVIKHIGDSRVYLLGDNDISVLTMDHSWVGEQVRSAVITPEEARNHPDKNILTQCIGVRNDIEVNSVVGELGDEGALLLCSDGFYNVISDPEIQKYLKIYKKYRKPAQKLVEEYFGLIERREGQDDASAIVLW